MKGRAHFPGTVGSPQSGGGGGGCLGVGCGVRMRLKGGDSGRRDRPVRAEDVNPRTAVSAWKSVGLLPVVRKVVLVHEVIFVL